MWHWIPYPAQDKHAAGIIDHDPEPVDHPEEYLFARILHRDTVLVPVYADVAVIADLAGLHLLYIKMLFRKGQERPFLLQEIMLVGDPFRCRMFPAAPVIYEFFPAPVQFFHAGKRVSLYELLFYVIEGTFYFLSD